MIAGKQDLLPEHEHNQRSLRNSRPGIIDGEVIVTKRDDALKPGRQEYSTSQIS